MQIREARADERDALLSVHRAAFGNTEGEAAGDTIATLVAELLDDPTAQPVLSLVAEADGELVGHVLFTSVTLADQAVQGGYILAPLAVLPGVQGRGVGSTLMRAGLEQLRSRGATYVMVLGDPNYYGRAGFATGHQIKAPHEIPYPEAWMAQELVSGALAELAGTLRCANALNAPEHW